MRISALTAQIKNPERVNVFIDGTFQFSLTKYQILELGIKVGIDFDDDLLLQLIEASKFGKLRERSMRWALLRPRSAKEFQLYLIRKNPRPTSGDIQALLKEFSARKWIDDYVFAEWWVGRSSRRKKSLSHLKGELFEKGISREIITEVLGDRGDSETVRELAATLAQKTKYKDQEKLMRYLVSRGFSYSSVREALADVAGDKDD